MHVTNKFRGMVGLQTQHLASLLMILTVASTAGAQYGGGGGTVENPYQIWTAEQMNAIGADRSLWNKHFRLMADIDMAECRDDYRVIGNYYERFMGSFDGNGRTIRNLACTKAPTWNGVGLFGGVERGQIKDLILADPNVGQGTYSYVGALVGYGQYSTVTRCAVRGGYVRGKSDVGGLVGFNGGDVRECTSSANVTGVSSTGGLVGYLHYGTIANCYCSGSAQGTTAVGGLVGYCSNQAAIGHCYSLGPVQGESKTGGLLGQTDGKDIWYCFWDIEASGQTTSAAGAGKTSVEMKRAETYGGWGSDGLWTILEGLDYPRLAWENRPGEPFSTPVSPPPFVGSGTAEDPFLIHTADELNTIGLFPDAWDKHYRLAADIDMSTCPGTEFNVIGRPLWYPSYGDRPFTGVFDGHGKSILHYTYTPADPRLYRTPASMFGSVARGEICDLELVDPNIVTTQSTTGLLVSSLVEGAKVIRCKVSGGHISALTPVGGLVGSSYLGVITDCEVESEVSGRAETGGIVGSNRGEMTHCRFEGRVVSVAGALGGLAGSNSGAISRCTVSADVVGATDCWPAGTGPIWGIPDLLSASSVGGLAGGNRGSISQCSTTGHVSGITQVGGLLGGNNGTVTECFSSADVCGSQYVGGLTGQNGLNRTDVVWSGRVHDSYATGTVSGRSEVGGLVGFNDGFGTIRNCYSVGGVTGTTNVGGLVGDNDKGEIYTSFWDTQASGSPSSDGGTGKTTAEMHDPNTFLQEGWPFVDLSTSPNRIWAESPDAGYPVLWWQLSPQPELPAFSGGSGEPNDPYLLTSDEDLNQIGCNPRLMNAHFMLMNDIDVSGVEVAPIGDQIHPFAGSFNGNGQRIRGFTLISESQWWVGLFGYATGAEIRDLRLVDAVVDAPVCHEVGALVGRLDGGTVTHCEVVGGTVHGGGRVGLLIGSAWGTVTECYSDGSVAGYYAIGGLVGVNHRDVTHCSSTAKVSTTSVGGGLVGVNDYYGRIEDSWAAGTVSGESWIGGLVGTNGSYALITGCRASGTVSGTSSVGGLVGANSSSNTWDGEPTVVCGCYANAQVDGQDAVGGLVGTNSGCISLSYSAGVVHGKSQAGGLIGRGGGGTTYLSYWDAQSSGMSMSAGGVARSTAEMKSVETLAGWSYAGLWQIDGGKDYPRLAWEGLPGEQVVDKPYRYGGGSGEPNDPFQIGTAEQFVEIAYHPEHLAKHFVLTNDIDLPSGTVRPPLPIGVPDIPFSGYFDGAGHVVAGFSCLRPNDGHIGLFGHVAGVKSVELSLPGRDPVYIGGVIRNLGVVDANVAGFQYVGALAGFCKGTVDRCFATGSVRASSQAGGLVGYADYPGTINRSFSTSSVSGDTSIGGLVGVNESNVSDCYARGTIKGKTNTGGIGGGNWSTVARCYFAGVLSGKSYTGGIVGRAIMLPGAASCFWDVELSGVSDGIGSQNPDPQDVLGKTTAEMQTPSIFLSAGWDFAGETANGAEDIWWIDQGEDYPRLSWEKSR